MSDTDLDILRSLMRRSSSMSTWRHLAARAGARDPDGRARQTAFEAKARYELTIKRYSHFNPSPQNKLQFAAKILDELTEKLREPITLTYKTIKKRRKNRAKSRCVPTPSRPEQLKKAASGKDVVERPEPFRRNYMKLREIPSHKLGSGKGKIEVGARIETPSYARYADEGIGGTREQALDERKKLSDSMLRRAWD